MGASLAEIQSLDGLQKRRADDHVAAAAKTGHTDRGSYDQDRESFRHMDMNLLLGKYLEPLGN